MPNNYSRQTYDRHPDKIERNHLCPLCGAFVMPFLGILGTEHKGHCPKCGTVTYVSMPETVTHEFTSYIRAELEQSDLLPCGHSVDSLGGFGGCNPNGSCLECLKLEQEKHKALQMVLDVTAPKLPPAKITTMQQFAEARERRFNQFYYGNQDGLPYFPHQQPEDDEPPYGLSFRETEV